MRDFAQLRQGISSASTTKELLCAHQTLGSVFDSLSAEAVPIRALTGYVQAVHDDLFRRSIELTLLEFAEQGLSIPPTSYTWFVLGSGARGEQTLWTDQDHALIYETIPGQENEVDAYFTLFAEQVVQNLASAGYPLCPGYVMATNPRWRGTLGDWQKRMGDYLAYPDWDNVRFLLIAADMRRVYGDQTLGDFLHALVMELISHRPFLLWMAADHGLNHKVALSLFQRIQPELAGDHKGDMNLKEGLHHQLVNSVRLWALANDITDPSTFARVEGLNQLGIWDERRSQQIQSALETSLTFKFRYPSGYVRINNMEREEYEDLFSALKVTRHLQLLTAKQFVKPGG
ncbi:MAG: hypothetical protein JWN30_2709 [Bacilli bacterium]|nr:hypothetical protein [Bacilli bacterium]